MSNEAYTIIVRGIPNQPAVNVRAGPNTAHNLLFKVDVGVRCTVLLDIEPDEANQGYLGKAYSWFKIYFPDGRVGWVRDDLVDVVGDLAVFGYGKVERQTMAFNLTRELVQIVEPTPMTPSATPAPAPRELSRRAQAQAAVPSAPAQQPQAVVPAQPAAPVAPVAPATAVAPTKLATAATPASTPEACVGTVRTTGPAKIRSGPSINTAIVAQVQPGSTVKITGVQPGQDGDGLRWVKVEAEPGSGFMREDLLSYEGAPCVGFGLTAAAGDLFPSPMTQYVLTNLFVLDGHRGWDFAAPVGTPVSGWDGGTVARTNVCSKCTASQPNIRALGLPLSDPSVLNDPAWGYGFGNFVIVRYPYNVLPANAKQQFDAAGLAGGFLYASYGHLSAISVTANQIVTHETQIGLSGDTGNSSGPHLHLELRASTSPQAVSLAQMKLMDPRFFVRR